MKLFMVILAALCLSAPADARPCVTESGDDSDRVFADVPSGHPFCVEIESLWRDGLTSGCRVEDDGTRYFCPDEAITRGMASMFAEHRDPFAQIDPVGRIDIGDHVRNAERYAKGVYWVQFARDIQRCSMEAWSQDYEGPGIRVDVDRLWGTVDTVVVEATNYGIPLDTGVNVRLHCR